MILPAVNSGHNVICERWNESTLAYQCGGHETDINEARKIISACSFPKPDMKILLDVSPELALPRIRSRNIRDKFEDEGLALMRKVSEFYRSLEGMTRIECGSLSEDEVFSRIAESVREWLSR